MNIPEKSRTVHLLVWIFISLLFVFTAGVGPTFAQSVPDNTENQIFLPLINNGSPGGSEPPPTQPPPEPVDGGFFLDTSIELGSSDIAVDPQGGLHMAFAHYTPSNEHPAAVYLYCSNQAGVDCTDGNSWRGITMLDNVNEVQLALTNTGKPRLLIRTQSQIYTAIAPGNDFYFVQCDQNCTGTTSWTGTYILSNHGTDSYDISNLTTPQRYFALDPQGRPRFVYQDRNYYYSEPDHYGAYYVYCDQECSKQANWYETRISEWDGYYPHTNDLFKYPSLTFTSSGQPRLLADVYPLPSQPQGIYYVACDANCDQSESWKRTWLFERGSGTAVSWDLELDSMNRPRAVFYKGETVNDSSGEKLYYAWCNDTSCLSASSWSQIDLNLGVYNGKDPDLELDKQDRPRIAYMHREGNGLGYTWCNQGCTSSSQWQHKIVEDHDSLQAEYPVPLPSHCDAGLWDSTSPVLSLSANGSPYIAFDIHHQGHCLYDPKNGQPPYVRWEHILWTIRVNYFTQP